MALTDLLVYVDQTENSLVSLRLAADLAIRHGSRLTALYATEWSRAQLDRRKSAELGLVSVQGLKNLDRHVEASIDAMAQRLRSTLDELTRGYGVEAELRSIDGVAAEVVPQYARYADLCILGRDEPGASASVSYTFSEQLLFVTGRPVGIRPTRGVIHNAWSPYCRGLEFEPACDPVAQRRATVDRTRGADDDPDGQSIGLHRLPPGSAGRADGRSSQPARRHGRRRSKSRMSPMARSPTGCKLKRMRSAPI